MSGDVTPCDALPADDLVAWVDGELAPPDAARVASHVAGCAVCARETDLLRRTGDLVARLPRDAAPPGFAASVLAAARDDALRADVGPSRTDAPAGSRESPASPLRSGSPWRFASAPWRAAAALFLVAVTAAGVWIARDRARGGDPDALTAREEEDIAADLFLLANLDTLRTTDARDLAAIADDLDVLEAAADTVFVGDGG